MNYYTIGIDIGGTHVRAVAYDLGQFTRNYTQTTERGC